jgi:hypothetical protein
MRVVGDDLLLRHDEASTQHRQLQWHACWLGSAHARRTDRSFGPDVAVEAGPPGNASATMSFAAPAACTDPNACQLVNSSTFQPRRGHTPA